MANLKIHLPLMSNLEVVGRFVSRTSRFSQQETAERFDGITQSDVSRWRRGAWKTLTAAKRRALEAALIALDADSSSAKAVSRGGEKMATGEDATTAREVRGLPEDYIRSELPPGFLTAREVASFLNTGYTMVDKLVRSGMLPAVKLGKGVHGIRIDPLDLVLFLVASRSDQTIEEFRAEHGDARSQELAARYVKSISDAADIGFDFLAFLRTRAPEILTLKELAMGEAAEVAREATTPSDAETATNPTIAEVTEAGEEDALPPPEDPEKKEDGGKP